MKTITERAVEYADRHKATEIDYFGVDKVYGYTRIYNAEITAYERGATEQKALDINMACEWLLARNVLTEASIEGFRKAMGE